MRERRGKINYSYLNQETVRAEVITAGLDIAEEVILEQQPVDHERFVENYRLLPDSMQLLKDPLSGNEVAAYWANRDADRDKVIALITTRQSSLATNGGNRREYALVGAMNPGVRFVILDSPGTGPSTKLPPQVMDHTIATGRFDKAAAIVAGALDHAHIHPLAFIGVGTGGRYAIGASANVEPGQVRKIGGIDPEGQSDMGFLRQNLGMLKELMKHERAFREATKDPYAVPHDSFPDVPKEWEAKQPVRVARNLTSSRSAAQIFIQVPRALRHGGQAMAADMEAALGQQDEATLDYVSPEKSELLKHPDDPVRVLGYLSAEAAAKVRIIRIPEATHYFTAAHPRLVGAIVKEVLRDSVAA
jgi:pimeloyl-ACP methyl ester carboxylesterase